MPPPPAATMIIVGGDALALSTAYEIGRIPGHRVVVLWPSDAEFAARVEAAGACCIAARPDSRDGLDAAGVMEALAILALSPDDQLNLQSALRARDANPRIRIVLRQFNRTFATKIEQNLANCSVLSLAWHSAATYAAAALDPSCLRGVQFPEPNGPLTGFAARAARAAGVAGMTVEDAERTLGARIIAVDGDISVAADERIAPEARLILYAAIERLLTSAPRQPAPPGRASFATRMRQLLRQRRWRLRRLDPYVVGFVAAALLLFALATWHFRNSFGSNWLVAAYFVLTTMTTTGYGDIAPNHRDAADVSMAMLLMLLGTVFTGIFIAFLTARLTRAHWVRMQGLRPIRRRGHIVVCGCGSIGTGVIDLLLAFDKPLVVIEQQPDTALVERARDRGFDLLTGDASRDATLDLCNLGAAHSLVALTNVDTLNLEIGLGARVRNPSMPIVLRIAEATFAASIARHFQFETTFSVAALAGPVFAGLSRLPGVRGRLAFDGQEYGVAEVLLPEEGAAVLPRFAIPLAVAGPDDRFALVRDFDTLTPGNRVLLLVPLAPLQDGSESLPEIVMRAVGG